MLVPKRPSSIRVAPSHPSSARAITGMFRKRSKSRRGSLWQSSLAPTVTALTKRHLAWLRSVLPSLVNSAPRSTGVFCSRPFFHQASSSPQRSTFVAVTDTERGPTHPQVRGLIRRKSAHKSARSKRNSHGVVCRIFVEQPMGLSHYCGARFRLRM